MPNRKSKYSLSIIVGLIALILISVAWIMQGYSLINWDNAVEIGLQEHHFSDNTIESHLADVERGIAMADIIWGLPLTIFAFIGILRRSLFGFLSANMVFAICVYFPLLYFFRDNFALETKLFALGLWCIPSLLGIVSLWYSRNQFTKS